MSKKRQHATNATYNTAHVAATSCETAEASKQESKQASRTCPYTLRAHAEMALKRTNVSSNNTNTSEHACSPAHLRRTAAVASVANTDLAESCIQPSLQAATQLHMPKHASAEMANHAAESPHECMFKGVASKRPPSFIPYRCATCNCTPKAVQL
jgi:hypothetical protein